MVYLTCIEDNLVIRREFQCEGCPKGCKVTSRGDYVAITMYGQMNPPQRSVRGEHTIAHSCEDQQQHIHRWM